MAAPRCAALRRVAPPTPERLIDWRRVYEAARYADARRPSYATAVTDMDSFVRTLVDRVLMLRAIHQEHVRYYDELIPHVFMGDVLRVAVELHESALNGDRVAEKAMTELLAALEAGMASGKESVKEMITVSFLEHLDREDFALEDFRQRLGPTLRRQLQRLEEQ